MYKHLALVVAILAVMSHAKLLADPAAKPNDPQIAHIAYTAGLLDVEAGKQALDKSQNKDVRAFAQRMIGDHTAVNDQALALVKKLNVTPEDNPTSQTLTNAFDTLVTTAVNSVLDSIKRPSKVIVTANEADKHKCFADYLFKLAKNDKEGLVNVYGVQKAPLAESLGGTGGFLVPVQFLDILMEIAAEDTIVRPRADVIPMASRTIWPTPT